MSDVALVAARFSAEAVASFRPPRFGEPLFPCLRLALMPRHASEALTRWTDTPLNGGTLGWRRASLLFVRTEEALAVKVNHVRRCLCDPHLGLPRDGAKVLVHRLPREKSGNVDQWGL